MLDAHATRSRLPVVPESSYLGVNRGWIDCPKGKYTPRAAAAILQSAVEETIIEGELHMTVSRCSICGGTKFARREVLWQGLVDEWQLAPDERAYVDRQQGETCTSCGANLRSIALADALRAACDTTELLKTYAASAEATGLRILELNEAGTLSPILRTMKGHTFGAYPEVDMHALPYPDETFDIVVHSDTLEHVPEPVHALGECRRVLKHTGALCFTVPIIVGRLSRSRIGLPKSYHGDPTVASEDFVVRTEFGADAWTLPIQAGFTEVCLHAVDYPAALAMAAYRRLHPGAP